MSRKRFWTIPILTILLVSLLLSCTLPFSPRPTPTPTAPPLPDTQPTLLVRSPARGEETPLDRPLRLVFDQPMDRASVEAAFHIEPKVEGTFSWPDPVTLVFTPRGEWKRATRYRVQLDAAAKSAKGLPLREEISFTFATVGYLEVTQVIPEPNARDIAPDSTVTVMFNRPVVPLQLVSAPTVDMPVPLLFDPPVEGTGEWVNTSIYVFRPKEGFVPGQTYTAKVPAGLSDTTGGVLEEDFTWTFTIEHPYVLSVDPPTVSTQVARNRPITVTFSMPMDRASAQAAFSLKPLNGETAVPGRFSWSENDTVMTFTPEGLLDYDTPYVIRIDSSARSRLGNAPLKADYQYSFRTVPRPAILRTMPANGDTKAEPGTDFLIYFASPMDLSTVMPNITIIPTPTRVYSYWNEGENAFVVSFGPDPSASYEVRLGGRMADPYGTTIGKETVVRFTTRALDPALYLQVPGNIGLYNAYTSTYVYVSHLNVTQVDLTLHYLTWEEFRRLTTGDWWSVWESFSPPEEHLVRRWTVPVEAPLNEARYKRIYLSEDEGPLPPGLYLLQASAPEVRQRERVSRHILVVSRTHLTLKLAQREALVWATDLSTGKPVSGLNVTIQGPGVEATGRTDRDGVFRTGFPPLEDIWKPFLAFSGTPGSDDFAVVHSDWYSGIGPWDFGLSSEFSYQPYRIYVYTDRPIYRPGQPVYFRGVIRAEDDVRYSLPSGEVSVTVRNDQGEEIYQATLPLSEFGTFNGEFTLAKEAGLGYYYIEVEYGKQTGGVGFQVAAYRRPEFQVTVTPDKDQVLAGEKINVAVQATYFFGGPVADAQVHWTLMAQDYWFRPDVPGWWDWTDTSRWDWWQPQEIPGWGRVVADGEGVTDAQGRFVFSVPADIGDAIFSQQFTIEATVTDVTDQSVSNRAQVIVHKGLFYIGLRPQQYVGVAGEEQKIDIRTVDWDGEPVARVPLTVTLNRREWLNVQEEDEYGNLYWTWTVSDTVVATVTVTTDEKGEGTVGLTPPSGGSYIVKAEGTDARGNRVCSATWLWVSGREYVSWRQENNDRIYLIADKREYRPGEVAKILIPSPFQGAVQALFTVERGHIIRHWVQTLPGNAETIELPITAEMVPNAFVSVVLVKGVDETNPVPAYRVGYVGFTVSPQKQELTVRITPDRDVAKGEHYGPRETVNLQIEVTDSDGNPVEAEVGIGVVDKSVLTLAPPNVSSIVEAFYGQRGLGVRTADNLSVSVDRISVKIAREAKGGGGGIILEAAMGAEFIRQEFPDTVFWAPSVRTDRDGRATVSFQLTDQLTTWHIDARAVAGGADEEYPLLVGQTELEILSTKDLLVRPVTPRFFVVGDRADVAAVVHNNTDRALEVEVSLEAQGANILGEARQMVSIPAGGKVRVEWPLEVRRDLASDRVDLVFRARGGGLSDAVKPPAGLPPDQYLPVYRYSAVEVVGTAGQLTGAGSVVEGVAIPPTIDTTQGDLTIKLEPSLAAGMVGGLKYLEHFPYECTEQLVSRFLPNVLTYRALKELGLAKPELEARLRDLVAGAIQKLYQRQHPDGGWGWWTNDQSNPLTSAYVVFGLVKAKEAGFAVDEKVLTRGIEYLKRQPLPVDQLKDTPVANRQAFILYVLAEAGEGDESRLASLYEVRGRLGYYGRAYLALALGILNPEDTRIDTILADLASAAIVSGTGVHWQEAQPEPWNWNTDTRTTAIVLALLARFDPQNPLAPNVVRWLMRARTADHWETTQETAWALIALTDWLVATKELEGNYAWGVQVNGREVGSGRVTPDTVQEVTELRVAIKDLLLDQVNRVAIARGEGPGRLYYTVHLRGYLPVEQVQALNRGIVVGRVYERADCEEKCEPVTTARVGDLLRVRLTVIAPSDLNYVVIEDPFPAGTDPVDTSLQTTSVVGERPEFRRTDVRSPWGWWGWGWWWFADTDLRDEKLVLFATELPRGTYEYTYLLQVGLAGEYRVLPATAYEMYFPEVMGRSDGMVFTIQP